MVTGEADNQAPQEHLTTLDGWLAFAKPLVVLAIAALLAMMIVSAFSAPAQTRVIQVGHMATDSCGWGMTCHYVALLDRTVLKVDDTSWVTMQAGLCYRVNVSRADSTLIGNAEPIACP